MLSLIILLPLAATALIWMLPDPRKARWVAGASALLTLCLTLALAVRFDAGDGGFQFMERLTWIPTLGIRYTLGVDGISVLFLPLTALLFLGVTLASWTSARRHGYPRTLPAPPPAKPFCHTRRRSGLCRISAWDNAPHATRAREIRSPNGHSPSGSARS